MNTHLKSIAGGCGEQAVLSLIHATGRVDISSRELIDISVQTHSTFLLENRQTYTTKNLHVLIQFEPSVSARISASTYQIVGEPMSAVVAGKVVTSPIVREPLWGSGLTISCHEISEAEDLARQLRAAWQRPALRVV